MQAGKNVYTPRFCTVTIKEVFDNVRTAREAGYTEPTHYHKDGWTVLGRVISCPSAGWCEMVFAAAKD